jgi:non-ribosomal peptide synthetase component F
LAGNPTFRDLLARVRASTAGALAHQELPFEKLVESLRVRRDPSFNPLFQVNFRAHAQEPQLLQLPGVRAVGSIDIDIGFSRFDLALELQIKGGELGGYFEYDEDLFDAATIDVLAADFEQLVRKVVVSPETPILALVPRRAGAGQNRSPIPRTSH